MYTQCEFLLHELRVKFDWKEKVILNIDNYFENSSLLSLGSTKKTWGKEIAVQSS